MYIDKWVEGYKVYACDSSDGENIYMHIEYYNPGTSLSKPPARETTCFIPKSEESKLNMFLNSFVLNIMEPWRRKYSTIR